MMAEKNGVSLENYIREVCEQIVRGVLTAQKSEDIGNYIGVAEKMNFTDVDHSFVTNVKFDVSAEVSTNVSGKGKVGINIVGASGEGSKSASSANRISFQVPVAIPLPQSIQAKHKAQRDRNNQALSSPDGTDWKTV